MSENKIKPASLLHLDFEKNLPKNLFDPEKARFSAENELGPWQDNNSPIFIQTKDLGHNKVYNAYVSLKKS